MENIMLNSHHTQIKIVDFGLSNTYTENNPLRTHCGSPEYAAPELFMEGKQYGPEVDLWSLGVILYGMVVGQLPFVTVRECHMTSQERRRKLLEQISKGMAAPHRRALAGYSPDFKMMISKLLVADSTRRIAMKELIFHPWITEKGKKNVRTNPMKKLDGQYQAIVMKDVSSLLHLNLGEVDFAVKSEPRGNIAGVYNILAFKQTLHQLEGDGITRNLPDQAINYLATPRGRAQAGKETKQGEIKIMKRREVMKSAPLPKTAQFNAIKAAIVTSKNERPITPIEEKMHKKKVIPKGILSRWKMTAPGTLPTIDAESIGEPPHRHMISAEDRKRQKLSHKVNEPSFAGNGEGNHFANILSPKCSEMKTPIIHLATSDKSKYTEAKAIKIKMTDKLKPKELTLRIQSANTETAKNDTAEQLHRIISHTRRPLTGPMHTAERAVKRRSMLPVTVNTSSQTKGVSSANATTNLHHNLIAPQRAIPPSRIVSTTTSSASQHHCQYVQQNYTLQPAYQPRQLIQPDREPQVATKRFIMTPPKNTRPFLNEPIARSIAGYVVNNIPTKLQTFKWIKAGRKGNP